ncbi:unnamed protein product [Cylicostephanus goldi]|uniref:Uncharacterized protein n=1 Tax=Cylicostephanus goldi TaxID=71465 RepID=A0A3P6QVF2_CYLGO|nr:unnamed protein product [Cylicostephanus goldi]
MEMTDHADIRILVQRCYQMIVYPSGLLLFMDYRIF